MVASKSGRFPDFIGIGAMKAGTTWLFEMLNQHPQVSFARENMVDRYFPEYTAPAAALLALGIEETQPIKEVHFWNFFRTEFANKEKYIENYKALFCQATSNQKAGEVTPNYHIYGMLDNDILRKMHYYMPHIKLIFLLRNPVERYLSHFFFDKSKGVRHTQADPATGKPIPIGPEWSLSEDLKHIVHWIRSAKGFDLVQALNYPHPALRTFLFGLYDLQIKFMLRAYPRAQLLPVVFDDIREHPGATLKEICRFIGIADDFAFSTPEKPSNPTRIDKTVDPAERHLLTSLYKPSVLKLSQFLNRNLDHWLIGAG